MRYFVVILLLCSSLAIAKDRNWEEAKVLRLTVNNTGTQAIVVPVGTGLYGASAPTQKAFFWLQTEKYTYVVPNYCKGAFIQWWLRVTIGGTTKVFPENSKTMRIIDDDGKERKIAIVQRIANKSEQAAK